MEIKGKTMDDSPGKLCDTCPFHGTTDYRISELERTHRELNDCVVSIKKDVTSIVTALAVMQQKFDNIRVPIWIIFGALLIEIAKWLIPFAAPVASAAVKMM